MSRLYDYFASKAFVYKIALPTSRRRFKKKAKAVCEAVPALDRKTLLYRDYRRAHRLVRCSLGEFFEYELHGKSDADILAYITMYRKHEIITQLGDRHAAKTIPGDKRAFNTYFAAFLQRAWLDLAVCPRDAFIDFARRYGTVIIKTVGSYQGKGIRKYRYTTDADAGTFYDRLRKKDCIAEECIRQHAVLSTLNPPTVNTLRISTLSFDGRVHFIGACLKMGCGEGVADNLVKGGIGCAVDVQTGVVRSDGFGHNLKTYPAHPVSGVVLRGLQIPHWETIRETVTAAAQCADALGDCRWIGWDVAVTPDGAAIIEGNWNQGLNLIQCRQDGKYRLVRDILDGRV